MQAVLKTGRAGFIGSILIPNSLKKNQELNFLNLDLLMHTGNWSNLKEVQKDRLGFTSNTSKKEEELSWIAQENFESEIRKTITWYLHKYNK